MIGMLSCRLGDAGSSLVPLLATKSSIETFLTIPLVSKAGLHFPGIIIPIAAGVTTWLQFQIMMMIEPPEQRPRATLRQR